MSKQALFVGSGLLLVLGLVAAALFLNTKPAASRAAAPPAHDRPAAQADAASLARFHSPSFGDAGAKVHIVEFFDPACETCRAFYPYVKEMMAANPGRIRLTLRYVAFHKGSDQVVRMIEAARRQGKHREALEALLAAQSQWVVSHVARPDLALAVLKPLGLDMQKLEADMRSDAIGGVLQQDMQDAVALNVTKTPEFFVNGRSLPRFGYNELRGLVEQALRESYGQAS